MPAEWLHRSALLSHPMLYRAPENFGARHDRAWKCSMSYILHEKVEGFVSGLLVIQPAYSEKQFEELIKNRLAGGSPPLHEALV
ncbi:hypothetical protein B2M20_10870 [Nitrobacter vulgaris]|uniref:Uncharacterized protein n=1 Tax=Nitrobacter vulgaris TaxID=29421 RepID=A0A1V4HXK7_NITVU|nr:hypothetical protein B2M20_10870 [Nitrobacter vulgaris]